MGELENGNLKRYVVLLLTLSILFEILIVGGFAIADNQNAVLAVLEDGEIYEFRYIGNNHSRLRLEGSEESVGDVCIYGDDGSYTSRGSYLARWDSLVCKANSLIVIEHRMGSGVKVLGNPDEFQVRRLQTPALYVQTMTEGAILEFLNSGSDVEHTVNWTWSGYPSETAGVGWDSIFYHTVSVDGRSSNQKNSQIFSGTGVKPGEKLVLYGNQGDWPREVVGSYTTFSGQPYHLTIDGERSYPPASVKDSNISSDNSQEKAFVKYKDNDKKTTSITFEHPLEWYLKNKSSVKYDVEVAELSMALSKSVYDSSSVKESLKSHGFLDSDTRIYDTRNAFSYKKPAFSMAKKINESGETIVVIIIQGTDTSTMDLVTDASIGYGDTHFGFNLASEYIYNQMTPSFVDEFQMKDKTTFLITGHSYGGAVANLLSKKLIEIGVPQEKVFAYTFASPNVAKHINEEKKLFKSIFNICNTLDPVPKIPRSLKDGVWDKYGRTFNFTADGIVSEMFGAHNGIIYLNHMRKHIYPDLNGSLGGVSKGNIINSIIKLQTIGFLCPVNIDILNSKGELIGQFIDNQSRYLNGSEKDFILYVIGDEKYIVCDANNLYSFKIKATNAGKMDYIVEDYDVLLDTSATKIFEGIPLVTGKQMISSVGNKLRSSEVQMFVTNVEGKIIEELKGEVVRPLPFVDIFKSAWYYDIVCNIYSRGLMSGMSDTIFEPEGTVTLAQAITMAARVHEDFYSEGKDEFEKNGSSWYDVYVEYALKNNLIKLEDFTNYNDIATRDQIAYVFSNVFSGKKPALISKLNPPDVRETDKYGKEIYLLYEIGVLSGNDSKGTFSSSSNITRAESAAILLKVHTLLTKKESN